MATKCPKCHSENPDTQSFCGTCGTKLLLSTGIDFTETLEAAKLELSRGIIFAERYRIIEKLGIGGMGAVYPAVSYCALSATRTRVDGLLDPDGDRS